MSYPKGTNGTNADYVARVGALFDAINQGAMRSFLINGAMDVAQRATSYVGTTSLLYGCVDRWILGQSGSAQVTFSQAAPSPALAGFKNCLKVLLTGTSTGAVQVAQALETVDSVKMQGQNVCVSFWALKGSTWNPPSLGVRVYCGQGADQSAASFASWTSVATPIDTTVSPSTSWAKFEATVAIPSGTTQVAVVLYALPTGAAVDSNSYLMATGLKLELGTASTGWAPELIGETLAKCQRYYEKSYATSTAPQTNSAPGGEFVAAGAAIANTIFFAGVSFKQAKRSATPAVNVYSFTSSVASKVSDNTGSDLAASSGVPSNATDRRFLVSNQSGGNITPASGGFVFHWTADAEL